MITTYVSAEGSKIFCRYHEMTQDKIIKVVFQKEALEDDFSLCELLTCYKKDLIHIEMFLL